MTRRDGPAYFLLVAGALLVSAFTVAVRQSTVADSGVCKVPPPPAFAAPAGP